MQPTIKATILLADDEQFIAIAYKDGLERAGYSVIVGHDGSEALELARTSTPDLLLLDLIMPKMNGFEVLQALRKEPELANLPVIVLTNLGQDSDEAEARSYGVTDFIVKADISLKDLLVRIEQVLAETMPQPVESVELPAEAVEAFDEHDPEQSSNEPQPPTPPAEPEAPEPRDRSTPPPIGEAPDIDLSGEETPSK